MFHSGNAVLFFQSFIFQALKEHRADVTYQKALALFHLSKGYSPRCTVACQHASWQTPVIFYVSLSKLVLCWVYIHGAHFHSQSDIYTNQTQH